MSDKFREQLEAARAAGKVAAKRNGQTVKAITLRLMDGGAGDAIEVLTGVLDQRGELPGWLQDAPRHEVAAVLSAWGGVRHAMREHGKGQHGD